jgi:ribosomal protein S14
MTMINEENKIKLLKLISKQPSNNNLKFYFLFHKRFYNRKKRVRYCLKTKRTKGFYKFFNLSRQTIKEFSKNEQLPGILKSSW